MMKLYEAEWFTEEFIAEWASKEGLKDIDKAFMYNAERDEEFKTIVADFIDWATGDDDEEDGETANWFIDWLIGLIWYRAVSFNINNSYYFVSILLFAVIFFLFSSISSDLMQIPSCYRQHTSRNIKMTQRVVKINFQLILSVVYFMPR